MRSNYSQVEEKIENAREKSDPKLLEILRQYAIDIVKKRVSEDSTSEQQEDDETIAPMDEAAYNQEGDVALRNILTQGPVNEAGRVEEMKRYLDQTFWNR